MNLVDASLRIAVRDKGLVSIDRFSIPEKRILFLFGESGIGKTIIAKALYGLLDPELLEVRINDEPYVRYLESPEARNIRQNGFFVFQEPSSHLNPLMQIQEQLREGDLAGREGEEEVFGELWPEEDRQKVGHLLPVYPRPFRPSGGEKQRMLLAMAFKKIRRSAAIPRSNRGLFVFDEPTGSLDDALRNRFLSYLFRQFTSQPFTTLFITHDYSMISAALAGGEHIRDHLVFRQLVSSGDAVKVRDFSPSAYTTWIASRKAEKRSSSIESSPVVILKGEVQAIGHRFLVSSDPDGRQRCDLHIRRGRIAYLKGASGTGKTTLAKAIMGLIACRKLGLRIGSFLLDERTPQSLWRKQILGRKLTMVFQHADEALNLQTTVKGAFDGLPLPHRHAGKGLRHFLRLLFEEDELGDLLRRGIRTLSGGQKQKINLLRSLILDTGGLILDEPLNGLDFQSTTRVLELLSLKRQEGKGLLVISHNEEIFDTQADEVYYLHGR